MRGDRIVFTTPDCVLYAYVVNICRGDCIMVKTSRETFLGKIEAVSPVGFLLNTGVVIKFSKVVWLRKVDCRDEEGSGGAGSK